MGEPEQTVADAAKAQITLELQNKHSVVVVVMVMSPKRTLGATGLVFEGKVMVSAVLVGFRG